MEKRKRTILWIIPILVLLLFIYVFGPKKAVTDNDYVSYIKATPLTENSTTTTENAFVNYCENGSWEYFQTKMMDHVVEFKGKCKVIDTVQTVNLQYIVEKNQTGYRLGAMLVDGVQQTEQERTSFLQTVENE